jgi:hypothetical protein
MLYLKNDDFDEASKIVYNQLPKTNSSIRSRVMLNIERFEIGQSYVTAKVQNRYGDNVNINIQGGRPGIEIQASLFKLKEQEKPSYVILLLFFLSFRYHVSMTFSGIYFLH